MSKLKIARMKHGVKQKAVAEAIGVSRQTYARYEENPDLVTHGQAKTICNFLNEDVADIFLS